MTFIPKIGGKIVENYCSFQRVQSFKKYGSKIDILYEPLHLYYIWVHFK